ncbi:MAG TPA: hypothetical protein VEW46_12415, partial [Pyrinomonadaceae bacterium]|nr:hypothetical protein [Pyrinomonadaceae bacterium]
AASISYPVIFMRWPTTRDFPWVTLLLYVVAAALLVIGIRRAFASGRALKSKIAASILTALTLVIMGLFLFSTLIMSRWLPASQGAPQVGQKAPDFSLVDANGKTVSLSELLSSSTGGQQMSKPKGVLLIFYRGYW